MHIFASIVDNFVDKVIHNLENTKAGVMVLDERL